MGIEVSEVVRPDSFNMPDKYSRYRSSDKGQAAQARRNGTKRSASLERYLARPFVAWDGEGINNPDGSHSYVLLANSLGTHIRRREGLGTVEVFECFLDSGNDNRVNVIFGGGYDFNMILKDLDRESLWTLYTEGQVKWHGYRLEWRQGKSFAVRTPTRKFLIYDVLPFFQCSFVKACDEYLGTDWEGREQVVREKANRSEFSYDDIEVIYDYCRQELRSLVRLVDELKQRLYKVEIRVSRWDGPGAVASALYKKYDTKSHIGTPPTGVAEAGRYAYAGGRFEIIRKGHSLRPAYQYDLRSAYPSAIRYLPCLAHGEWRYVRHPRELAAFGVYRVEVITPATQSVTQPQPLWMRNKDGTVYFSEYAHGWYWTPEAQLAQELGGVEIHEGWEWQQACEHVPFHFVEALYEQRAQLKREGNGAHVGLKLGLNSLYGKLAQQIGWQPGPPLKLPPYHSLEWAGYVTSHCRTEVYRAAMLAIDDVIAFETDAVFSREPIGVTIGEKLGQWDRTDYSSLTYLKSGMYFGTLAGGKEIEKSRGINRGSITRLDVAEKLAQDSRGYTATPVIASQTRFITLGQALAWGKMDLWQRWVTSPRLIQIALNGKRIDLLDKSDVWADKNDGWQETQEGFHDTEFSYPYPVAWIDGELESPEGLPLNLLKKIESDEMGQAVEYEN